MTYTSHNPSIFPDTPQQSLPNATAVLVLGILSIVSCCCWGGGLILGIIALVLAGKDQRLYNAAPTAYTPGSYNNLKAGKICAIIGVSFTVLYILLLVMTVGLGVATDPESLREAIEQYQR